MTASSSHDGKTVRASKARLQRLTMLCLLRKLYRNMLRADSLLQQPAPIHPAPALDRRNRIWRNRSPMASVDEDDEEAVEQRDAAVQLVAEMQLTAEQLRVRAACSWCSAAEAVPPLGTKQPGAVKRMAWCNT